MAHTHFITKSTSLSVLADTTYSLSPGEHLFADVATGVTLTAVLPLSSENHLAPVEVQRNGARGTITVVAVERDDSLNDRDAAGVSIGPGGDGYECLILRALTDDQGWVVISRG
jgi:hypothetical protein